MGAFSSRKRSRLWKEQGGKCFYCGTRMRRGGSKETRHLLNLEGDLRAATIDHVIPKADDGPGTWGNIVLACRGCNELKAARIAEPVRSANASLP